MKATKIYYEKCFNLGNFSNEKIGIEIEVEPGEKATEAIEKAKKFVIMSQKSTDFHVSESEAKEAEEIINNFRNYDSKIVMNACDVVLKYEIQQKNREELPF